VRWRGERETERGRERGGGGRERREREIRERDTGVCWVCWVVKNFKDFLNILFSSASSDNLCLFWSISECYRLSTKNKFIFIVVFWSPSLLLTFNFMHMFFHLLELSFQDFKYVVFQCKKLSRFY